MYTMISEWILPFQTISFPSVISPRQTLPITSPVLTQPRGLPTPSNPPSPAQPGELPVFGARIMALELQPPDGRKRVKVYELRNNDWFDRGTGFCTGQVLDVSPTASFSPVRNLSRPSFCCDFPHRPINFHAPAPARRSSRDSLLRAHEIIASSHHPFSSAPHPSNYSLAFLFE